MQHSRTLVGETDSDDLLNWLDAHSVSLSRGAAMHVVRERWIAADRTDETLAELLAGLIEMGWIELVEGLSPPHIRLTAGGYGRLLAATRFRDASEVGALQTAPRPRLYVTRERSPSEIALRNQLMSVFRDLRLRAGDLLIGVTPVRYWQEMGVRAGDLRSAFNVIMRDGYVRHRIRGIDTYWELTEPGANYASGPHTPDLLLQLAPAIATLAPQPPDDELRDMISGAFSDAGRNTGSRVAYQALCHRWYDTHLDENALLHAIDLAYKAGLVILGGQAPDPYIELTEQGAAHRPEHRKPLSRLVGKIGDWLR